MEMVTVYFYRDIDNRKVRPKMIKLCDTQEAYERLVYIGKKVIDLKAL